MRVRCRKFNISKDFQLNNQSIYYIMRNIIEYTIISSFNYSLEYFYCSCSSFKYGYKITYRDIYREIKKIEHNIISRNF